MLPAASDPAGMALITVVAVVNVPANALVVRIRLALGMAVRTREHQIIGRVRVAGGTDAIGSPVIGREPGVIEHRAEPGTGVVASLARGRETSGDMVRVVRSLVIRLVAAIAGGRQRGVVVVHVALRAGDGYVETGERESRQVMVEGCLQPRRGVVTYLARVGESHRCVRRIVGAVVIRHVASRARRVRQVVVSVYVTLCAGDAHVEAGQWEPGVVVIEGRRQPGNGGVANRAIDRKGSLHVVRIRCAVVIRHVA